MQKKNQSVPKTRYFLRTKYTQFISDFYNTRHDKTSKS